MDSEDVSDPAETAPDLGSSLLDSPHTVELDMIPSADGQSVVLSLKVVSQTA